MARKEWQYVTGPTTPFTLKPPGLLYKIDFWVLQSMQCWKILLLYHSMSYDLGRTYTSGGCLQMDNQTCSGMNNVFHLRCRWTRFRLVLKKGPNMIHSLFIITSTILHSSTSLIQFSGIFSVNIVSYGQLIYSFGGFGFQDEILQHAIIQRV